MNAKGIFRQIKTKKARKRFSTDSMKLLEGILLIKGNFCHLNGRNA
jgi:hypothetical protein